MMSPVPHPADYSFAGPSGNILGSNYVPMRPYALIFSVFSFFYSFWIFSFCYSLLFLLSFSIYSYSSLLILFFLSLLILLIPAPPIAASLTLTALLMIHRENPAKIPAKNPPNYSTACIVQQSNCRWHCEPTFLFG